MSSSIFFCPGCPSAAGPWGTLWSWLFPFSNQSLDCVFPTNHSLGKHLFPLYLILLHWFVLYVLLLLGWWVLFPWFFHICFMFRSSYRFPLLFSFFPLVVFLIVLCLLQLLCAYIWSQSVLISWFIFLCLHYGMHYQFPYSISLLRNSISIFLGTGYIGSSYCAYSKPSPKPWLLVPSSQLSLSSVPWWLLFINFFWSFPWILLLPCGDDWHSRATCPSWPHLKHLNGGLLLVFHSFGQYLAVCPSLLQL